MDKELTIVEKEELEKKQILNRYRSLLSSCKEFSREEKKIVRKAFNIALDGHKEMRRKSGEPYILHPIAVAKIAAQEMGLGYISIACALLHDVIEDTSYSYLDLKNIFGEKIADIVNGLTKITGVMGSDISVQKENFRKMVLTLSDDSRVILIKLCDRLHNMRTLKHMSVKNQLKISSETLVFYAPLAHRLGLHNIKSELEDLSLKYSETEMFQNIKQNLDAKKGQRNKYIKEFINPIKKYLIDSNILEFEIKGRSKSIYSIYKKMKAQGVTFEEVYDLFAIRIIIDNCQSYEEEVRACWQAYGAISSNYKSNASRDRNWISKPRSNGYESLHLTVLGPKNKWVEVQIRSRRMDEIAEKGLAAHWKYKDKSSEKEAIMTRKSKKPKTRSKSKSRKNKGTGLDEWIDNLRDILTDGETDTSEFLDVFNLSLYAKDVYVYTPKGDILNLPINATPLDFAYEIHTEVGDKCIGAKVGGVLVPLHHKLKNGEHVEVITSNKQKPNKEWLSFVVSSKAKNRIKNYFKQELKTKSVEGRDFLKKKFRNTEFKYNDENLNALRVHFNQRSVLDLEYQISTGKIKKEGLNIDEIIREYHSKIEEARLKGVTKKKNIKSIKINKSKVSKKERKAIVVGEDEDFDYSLSNCCNPLPGDKIFGYLSKTDGVKIHRSNCPNAMNILSSYGYRIIKAEWRKQAYKTSNLYLSGIKIQGLDNIGIVSIITDIISKDMGLNINNIMIDTNDGRFNGVITFYVEDFSTLDILIKKIRNEDKLIKVYRLDEH